MKTVLIFITMALFGLFSFRSNQQVDELKTPKESIYEISINGLSGEPLDLNQYKGKKLLIVNVASKCGFTPQYEGLQTLHETYGDKVAIIGVPCNQFLSQEPGGPDAIAEFCQKNYGVEFQITEKVNVKGSNQHALYQWLTSESKNGSMDSSVKWNFQKYLISENGELEAVFGSSVTPLSDEITSHFK